MVNERGQLLKSTAKLQLRIYKLKWQWWYDHDDNDYSDFITRYATDIIRDTLIACNDGRATFSMQVFNQNWGRYLVTLTDAEGGHQTGAMVYFDFVLIRRKCNTMYPSGVGYGVEQAGISCIDHLSDIAM